MSLETRRNDIVALLKPLTDELGGECMPYMPDSVNFTPSIWLADYRGTIRTAMSDRVYDMVLPLTVAVHRKGDVMDEKGASESLLAGIFERFDSDYTLGGTTFGLQTREFQQGAVGPIGGDSFVGFTLYLTLKWKDAVNLA